MPKAYMVTQYRSISEPDKLQAYAKLAGPAIAAAGGRIVERAPRGPVFAKPGHPYTQGLLDSIPPMHGPKPRRLRSIPGSPPLISALPDGCAFHPRCRFEHERCRALPPLFDRGGQEMACWLADERAEWPPLRVAPETLV